jgi:DNA-binding NarL/FixJ family response regulator
MYDDEMSIIKMMRNGSNGYVLKDVQPEELRKAIVALYDKGFYHSELLTSDIVKKASAHRAEEPTHGISDKELEFLRYCCTELTYKEIGEKMGNSPRTIDGYRDSLFSKLEVTSRTGLAVYAIKHGIVKL